MHRIILHVDMDAFFASVEQLDNPHLKGKPVIVGGVSERGVVSTCSYEARKFGVKSAMPVFMAQRLCPKGYFVRVRYHRYKEISNKIFAIFREVTQLVEPLSIDEAYLDVTNSRFTSGMEAAIYIKNRVFKEIGLTLSIGISYNKFLAKLASDWNKPNGIKVIEKDMIPEILLPLSISKIYGLGKKSVQRLNNMGIFIIEDLYSLGYSNASITAFVVGDTIASELRQSRSMKIENDNGPAARIFVTTFSQLVDTAEKRMFGLRNKLSSMYEEVPGMELYRQTTLKF